MAGGTVLRAPRRAIIVRGAVEPTRPQPIRCPTCRAAVRWDGNPFRPFCSDRCRIVDLGSWAAERYRIAGEPLPEDGDENGSGGLPH